ncbi:LysR family transcriptional regulator [Pseudoruegeria sp. SHC-113]|uniref:LysR family transcriptional regulator n=1 Tax=Pseudoruegeria sp. SHC-113 TaxID=2855439 RepID=UPI0021BA82EF|nr:LysR family transcriptional regulator [Pseudoruegeria sp. SHC-113]MCT8161884.1 LysR family transcriptional regulator [Pseudoruegeria sp. SHC-113]
MSKLKLEHLRTFLAVAKFRSVSRAAEALHLTQPAVTSRIKALEDSLGTALFDRTTAGMHLTKRGDMLSQYAEQFQHLAELVEEHVVDSSGVDRLMRLGVSETIAQSWLPDFVGALHSTFPQLKIEISVDISINLREQLLGREIDLAILLGPISDYTIDNVILPEVPLAWYCVPGADADGPVDLATIPIATYARNTRPYRELRAELFARFGPEVSMFPSSSLSSCFRMVEAGLAVGALPISLGAALERDGKLARFDPGWTPKPLSFSASYLGEPRSHLIETAARLAEKIARHGL